MPKPARLTPKLLAMPLQVVVATLTTDGFSGAPDGHQILTDFSHIPVTDHLRAALLVATYPYSG